MTPSQSATARAKTNAADPAVAAVERPTPAGANAPGFGSDVIAEALRSLDIPYIALTPGASYRGLHDSIVNYLGNAKPQMLLCLHEEAAVAIAHGYAKVTGKAMVTAVHSNVGLMHASMAMFNAWCDRMPVIVLGATGPVDAAKRRPWIDWIHTARDQGALVREYTKWDDQPASPGAAREAIMRGTWIANTAPQGPVYINFDAELQEMKVADQLPTIDVARYMPPISTAAPAELVRQAAAMLKGRQAGLDPGRPRLAQSGSVERPRRARRGAQRPRRDRSQDRRELSDRPSALCRRAARDHAGGRRGAEERRCRSQPRLGRSRRRHALRRPGAVGQGHPDFARPPHPQRLEHGPSGAAAGRSAAVGRSRSRGAGTGQGNRQEREAACRAEPARKLSDKEPQGFTNENIARSLRKVLKDRPVTYTHLPLSWDDNWVTFKHPLDYIGSDGGGGVGGGPGISVGAALALKGSGRLPIAICGDGDFLMGVTAVWTAVHYKIPLLFVLANNRSFYNDELHQERMARARNRPVENKWIGQRMSEPEVDLAAMGRAQGAVGFGPITKPADLAPALEQAIAAVDAGQVAVVDVRVEPGYTAVMTAAMTRAGN